MRYLFLFIFMGALSCNDGNEDERTAGAKDSVNSVIIRPETHDPFNTLDASPMDMIYYPVDYPQLKMTNLHKGDPDLRIIYSRPKKANRQIFGGLLKYDHPWRLGANESTEIELFKTAYFGDKKIAPGRYILYAIPQEKYWTIVVNSNVHTWGLQQDSTKDVARIDIPVGKNPFPVEYFTLGFEDPRGGVYLVMTWDDVIAKLPIHW